MEATTTTTTKVENFFERGEWLDVGPMVCGFVVHERGWTGWKILRCVNRRWHRVALAPAVLRTLFRLNGGDRALHSVMAPIRMTWDQAADPLRHAFMARLMAVSWRPTFFKWWLLVSEDPMMMMQLFDTRLVWYWWCCVWCRAHQAPAATSVTLVSHVITPFHPSLTRPDALALANNFDDFLKCYSGCRRQALNMTGDYPFAKELLFDVRFSIDFEPDPPQETRSSGLGAAWVARGWWGRALPGPHPELFIDPRSYHPRPHLRPFFEGQRALWRQHRIVSIWHQQWLPAA